MGEHTEGPWTYDPENGRVVGPAHDHPQSRKLGVELAQTSPIVCFVRGYHGSEEANTNGHLIAAAPDLGEACGYIVAWLESEDKGPDYGELTRDTHPEGERIWREWWNEQLELCDKALTFSRAALAKARGEK